MTTLTPYDPLIGRLDGLLNDFFRPAFVLEGDRAREAAPIRVDVKETAAAYVVSAEIPGASKQDIGVEIEGNEVTLSAETRRPAKAEGEKWLRVERFQGKAARRFALPQEIDEAAATAQFTDGVLELVLPKKQAVAARKVAIQ
jgi:HSP20 family protein